MVLVSSVAHLKQLRGLHEAWSSGYSVIGAIETLVRGTGKLISLGAYKAEFSGILPISLTITVFQACIMTTISVLRGPLFQRASFVRSAIDNTTGDLTMRIAQQLPAGYAGITAATHLDVNVPTAVSST